MADTSLGLAEPLFQTAGVCREKAQIRILTSLLICFLGSVLLYCSMPYVLVFSGQPITTMAWGSMKTARAWHFPQSPRAPQIQQPAMAAQSVSRLPRQPTLPLQGRFTNSGRGVPSLNSYESWQSDEKWQSDWDEEWQSNWWDPNAKTEYGTILHWNYDKRYGFIRPKDTEERYFTMKTDLAEEGDVEKDDPVVYKKWFDESRGESGEWRPYDVKRLRGDERFGVKRLQGTVKLWNKEKGFGFIKPKKGGKDIFVHFSKLVEGDDSVKVGDPVTYEEYFNPGARAVRAKEVIYDYNGKVEAKEAHAKPEKINARNLTMVE